jgi:hypothetical protein
MIFREVASRFPKTLISAAADAPKLLEACRKSGLSDLVRVIAGPAAPTMPPWMARS